MKDENKFIRATARLIQLTQEGIVRWTISKKTGIITEGTEDVVDLAYVATHEGRQLRTYEQKYKTYSDEYPYDERYSWNARAVLELIDEIGLRFGHFHRTRQYGTC